MKILDEKVVSKLKQQTLVLSASNNLWGRIKIAFGVLFFGEMYFNLYKHLVVVNRAYLEALVEIEEEV